MKTRLHALGGELRQNGQITRFLTMDGNLVHFATVEDQQDRLGAQDVTHYNRRLPVQSLPDGLINNPTALDN